VTSIDPDDQAVRTERLAVLAADSPLLGAVLDDLRNRPGLSDAIAEAVPSSRTDDASLSEFLSLVAREVTGWKLYGVATLAFDCVEERGVGHEALLYCVTGDRLDADQRKHIGLRLTNVSSPEGVVWCHTLLTTALKDDQIYHRFLVRHADTVLPQLFDEACAYLLKPNRGPGKYNVDTFAFMLDRADNPRPFQRRWIEWIRDGFFDRDRRAGSETAQVHYRILNEYWSHAAFAELAPVTHQHVRSLLRSESTERNRDGLNHLGSMLDARYLGAEEVLPDAMSRRYGSSQDLLRVQAAIIDALQALVRLNHDPEDETAEREFERLWNLVMDTDRTGITGLFTLR
jgi:hypothetical protein